MKKYLRNTDTVGGKIDDEFIIMDIDKGKYFSLNPVATDIWNLLEKPMSTNQICEKLLEQYDVAPAKCQIETDVHLKKMLSLGLIKEID